MTVMVVMMLATELDVMGLLTCHRVEAGRCGSMTTIQDTVSTRTRKSTQRYAPNINSKLFRGQPERTSSSSGGGGSRKSEHLLLSFNAILLFNPDTRWRSENPGFFPDVFFGSYNNDKYIGCFFTA